MHLGTRPTFNAYLAWYGTDQVYPGYSAGTCGLQTWIQPPALDPSPQSTKSARTALSSATGLQIRCQPPALDPSPQSTKSARAALSSARRLWPWTQPQHWILCHSPPRACALPSGAPADCSHGSNRPPLDPSPQSTKSVRAALSSARGLWPWIQSRRRRSRHYGRSSMRAALSSSAHWLGCHATLLSSLTAQLVHRPVCTSCSPGFLSEAR